MSDARPRFHFFPFGELTSPFYRNHEAFGLFRHAMDCTHSCYAPNLYDPFWDALYLILQREVGTPTGQAEARSDKTRDFPPPFTRTSIQKNDWWISKVVPVVSNGTAGCLLPKVPFRSRCYASMKNQDFQRYPNPNK
jgi:hypothetical protein